MNGKTAYGLIGVAGIFAWIIPFGMNIVTFWAHMSVGFLPVIAFAVALISWIVFTVAAFIGKRREMTVFSSAALFFGLLCVGSQSYYEITFINEMNEGLGEITEGYLGKPVERYEVPYLSIIWERASYFIVPLGVGVASLILSVKAVRKH